jgi:3-hydroxyacyl-CoA dehydrogenase / 3-hydroxy-2-methylbutyryl-CoA dehydrogenase
MADTPMIHKSVEAAKGAVERTQALLVFPKRMIRPEEFAHLAQSIIDNHMINAEVIRLDGGLRLAHMS